MDAELLAAVRRRAGEACEYCQLPQVAHISTFPIDHITAIKHGGDSSLGNLALSCVRCNSYKGPNIAGIDPATGQVTRLFHPRHDKWSGHFRWQGALAIGLTDIGRTTIDVLRINHEDYLALRASLIEEGSFPPR